jgi:N6-adenosine-specific RNA methylase IME4
MGRQPINKRAMTDAERQRKRRNEVAKKKKRAPLLAEQRRRQDREAELGARIEALPDRRCGVIVADPEWRFQVWSEESGSGCSASAHYPTSGLDVIKSRDVRSIAAPDCVLFLWAIPPMLPEALAVMAAWGFTYKAHVVWLKDKIGLGYWVRSKHEILLIGTRGRIPAPAPGTQWESVITAPTGRHSAKPTIFLERIEQLYPTVPKIELNCRGKSRPGRDAWGAEAETTSKDAP